MAIGTFLALVVWHADTLDSPPTRDHALGIWMEANYLAETHFDYKSLLEQEGDVKGGPHLYVISVLPSLIAAIHLLTGSAKATIVIYHLFTYACASLISLLVFVILRPFVGPLSAVLVCAAMLTTPMFSAQISLCGMEMPLAACGALAGYCVFRQQFVLAAACTMLAFAVKGSGMLITAAILAYLVVRFPLLPDRTTLTRRQVFHGISANGLAFALQVTVFFVLNLSGLGKL